MPSLGPSPTQLIRRAIVGFLLVQVAAIASLMAATTVRKRLRDKGPSKLPRVEPKTYELADGSSLGVYVSGAPLYEDMLAAINAAQDRVLFESYIVKSDAIGHQFKEALIAAANRGVDVYVIYDGFANLVVPPKFFSFPRNVKVLRYPVMPRGIRFWNIRNYGRDHRKILVVDDSVGFVGGYNIGSLYQDQWRDTHVAVRGDAVWDLANAFVDFWNMNRRDDPIPESTGASWDPHVRAHRNIPGQLMFPIRGMYIEAIDRAQSTIDITAAYFTPDSDILANLIMASERGVKVRILLPRVSNHVVVDVLARGLFKQLLEAGIEILLYSEHMVHAKTATIDGEWTTIGTANIDRLSLTGNYEINLEIIDDNLAAGMRQVFEDDVKNADPLTLEEWQSRPIIARLYEMVLAPLRSIL